jgi:L-ascorbate metabolism protein UlaG (beta-lactamase superfamily)
VMADHRGMPVTGPAPPVAIAWLGHSTLVIDVGGVRLLTDPLLRRHNWPLRRRGGRPTAGAWADVDAVLLSHLHHDHAELSSLRLLPGVPVLTAAENAAWLRRKGIDAPDDLGEDWVDVGTTGVRVRLVRADHHNRPMPHRPNAANGHLVRAPGLSVWVAGDTSLYPEMTDLPRLAGGRVDLAVVPVGGWGPRLSPGHLDPEQAARACAAAEARHAMPVHWGTLHAPFFSYFPRGWLDNPGEAFAEALRRHAPECRPIVLRPGEIRTLDLGPRDGSADRR